MLGTIRELGIAPSTTNMTQDSAGTKHVKGSAHSKSTAITKCHSGDIFEVEVTDNMYNMKYSVYPTCQHCTQKKSNLTVTYTVSIYRSSEPKNCALTGYYTASSGISY